MINLKYNYPSIPDEAQVFRAFVNNHMQDDALRQLPLPLTQEHKNLVLEFLEVPTVHESVSGFITSRSANQALFSVAHWLASNHHVTGIEMYSYNGFIEAARSVNLPLFSMNCDEEGITPEALEEAIAQGVTAIYVQPTLQNPTCSIMSLERKMLLAEMIKKHHLLVIEDDAYRFLHPSPPPLFLSIIPEHTLHIFSLNKPFNSFLSCCYIFYPVQKTVSFPAFVHVTGGGASTFSQQLATYLIQEGHLKMIIRKKQLWAEDLHRQFLPTLQKLQYHHAPCSFHYWIKLPNGIKAQNLAQDLMQKGIMVTSSHDCSIQETPARIRIALSVEPDPVKIEHALETIIQLIS